MHGHRLDGADEDEDVRLEELTDEIEKLSRAEYKVDEILDETFLDLDELAAFLDELEDFSPQTDDKLQSLVQLLKTDPLLRQHKVLIFTEYMATRAISPSSCATQASRRSTRWTVAWGAIAAILSPRSRRTV